MNQALVADAIVVGITGLLLIGILYTAYRVIRHIVEN